MSMFTIHVERGNALKRLLLPIAKACNTAHIHCTIQRLSFVISPRTNFVAVLRIFPAFFTTYQFNPNFAGHYTSFYAKFYIKLLHADISNMKRDLSITIYLNQRQSTIPVRFYDPHEFRKILTDLRVLAGEYVAIFVSTTRAQFKSLRGEIVYNTQDNDSMMIMGGVPAGGARQFFLICPTPFRFFYYTASISKLVWFFIAANDSRRHFLSCCVNIHASYLVCF